MMGPHGSSKVALCGSDGTMKHVQKHSLVMTKKKLLPQYTLQVLPGPMGRAHQRHERLLRRVLPSARSGCVEDGKDGVSDDECSSNKAPDDRISASVVCIQCRRGSESAEGETQPVDCPGDGDPLAVAMRIRAAARPQLVVSWSRVDRIFPRPMTSHIRKVVSLDVIKGA